MEVRKKLRLWEYDYSQNGAYFVTVCSKNRANIFSHISVGAGHPAGPYVQLSYIGEIVDKYIKSLPNSYPDMYIDACVVMPNHIHLLVRIDKPQGPAGCPAPTATLSKAISALKSLSSREAGISLWQRSFYDHIIRDEQDYLTRWNYIDTNPARWAEDEYYI